MKKDYIFLDLVGEKTLYYEEGEWLDEEKCGDETQKFLEYMFQNDVQASGYIIKKGGDEILDWDDSLYEWFEIWENNNRLCFGWWSDVDAAIRWFINEDEVFKIKELIRKNK